MKKFRGQKRYYSNLKNQNINELYKHLDFDSWFDFWHEHCDYLGYGNISWNHRKQHLDELFKSFEFLKEKIKEKKYLFQLFIIIEIDDSSQDAVFIHTKNPNSENFPHFFKRNQLVNKIPFYMRTYLNSKEHEWFCYTWECDEEIRENIIVYDKNIGVSVENESTKSKQPIEGNF